MRALLVLLAFYAVSSLAAPDWIIASQSGRAAAGDAFELIVVSAAGAFWFVQRVFFPGGIS